ncbi:MAG: efflux RND transporter periplasmic adaptor subunit [Clostridium sp.]|jgi:RND family efflux transporter MFP subunit|nr:efflux RND transporter periplasmic adaptor subunit [Clostridium sp.]
MKKNQRDTAVAAAPAGSLPRRKKKNMRRRTWIILAVLLLVVLLAVRLFACGGGGAETAVVEVTAPIFGDVEETVATSGTVVSKEQKVYFAPVSGILGEINAAAGDSVKSGDVLITYNMEWMEKSLREAGLQQEASSSSYQSTLKNSSDSQAKLREADANLAVLKQQIADNKNYLQQLQDQLSTKKRENTEALMAQGNSLAQSQNSKQREITALQSKGSLSGEEQETLTRLQQELSGIAGAILNNNYQQQLASSSSTQYEREMNQEITRVTELLAEYETYKARMESQKSSSETMVLDAYQQEQYAANQELARLAYQETADNYEKAQKGVVAEFDGVVMNLSAVEGATVTGGVQLLTLADSRNLRVKFAASRYDLEKLEIGQKADIVISGNAYEGEVSKINRMAAVNTSGTPMVDVEITILNPDDRIILGLDAKIEVHTHEAKGVLLVPVEAVNADKDGDFLYVVEGGAVARKSVVCGISSDTYVEIREGIAEAAQVILTSYGTLAEGMTAAILPSVG